MLFWRNHANENPWRNRQFVKKSTKPICIVLYRKPACSFIVETLWMVHFYLSFFLRSKCFPSQLLLTEDESFVYGTMYIKWMDQTPALLQYLATHLPVIVFLYRILWIAIYSNLWWKIWNGDKNWILCLNWILFKSISHRVNVQFVQCP